MSDIRLRFQLLLIFYCNLAAMRRNDYAVRKINVADCLDNVVNSEVQCNLIGFDDNEWNIW